MARSLAWRLDHIFALLEPAHILRSPQGTTILTQTARPVKPDPNVPEAYVPAAAPGYRGQFLSSAPSKAAGYLTFHVAMITLWQAQYVERISTKGDSNATKV